MARSILTTNQALILEQFKKDDALFPLFYFSGGTALSEMYFHHRESQDLDFFSDKPFNPQTLIASLTAWSKRLNFTITPQFVDPTSIYLLRFADGNEVKVDFAPYPYPSLGERQRYKEMIEVDSLLDIGANKLLTLTQRSEVKDFVDLYFLFKKFSLWDLKDAVKAKFRVELDPFTLAADFTGVEVFAFLPTMLVPLALDELKQFFLGEAKKLGQKTLT
ncbi:nucleotidyl transferase AbiEii/AbiGii toxin family protein [Patescibacteria group bacterium]|nr:nucleotidyl transferase AbiEii/AbiGii toxin family protein [Patescibacteria group bacterium]